MNVFSVASSRPKPAFDPQACQRTVTNFVPASPKSSLQVGEVADMARLSRGEDAIDDTLRHNLAEETTAPRVCGLAIDA